MRKKSLVASAYVLLAGAIPAAAADLPARPAPAPRVVVALYDWNGVYVGVNGGYSLGTASTTFISGPPVTTSTPNGTVFGNRPGGGVYGGQVGYNWHSSNVLAGVELDFQGTSQDDTITCAATCTPSASLRTRLPWFTTARARFGWAPDRWMIYATVGAVYASLAWTANQTGVYSFESRVQRFGWTGGAGIEWGVTNNLSVKAEYLYMWFGDVQAAALTPTLVSLSTRWEDHIIRAGLNFRFASAPVVVRY